MFGLPVASYIWAAINMVGLALLPLMLRTALGGRLSPWQILLVFLALATFTPLVFGVILAGDVKLVVLLALLGSFIAVRRGQWLLGAVTLSVASWLYVTMVVLLPWYLWRYRRDLRAWRLLGYFAIINLAALALLVQATSWDLVTGYIDLVGNRFYQQELVGETRTQAKLLMPLIPVLPQVVWPLITLTTGGVVALLVERAGRDRSGVYGLVAMIMVAFLLNNIKWVSHMALLIPAWWLLLGLNNESRERWHPALVVGAGTMVLVQASQPIKQLMVYLLSSSDFNVALFFGLSDVVAYSVMVVALLTLKEIRHMPGYSDSAVGKHIGSSDAG